MEGTSTFKKARPHAGATPISRPPTAGRRRIEGPAPPGRWPHPPRKQNRPPHPGGGPQGKASDARAARLPDAPRSWVRSQRPTAATAPPHLPVESVHGKPRGSEGVVRGGSTRGSKAHRPRPAPCQVPAGRRQHPHPLALYPLCPTQSSDTVRPAPSNRSTSAAARAEGQWWLAAPPCRGGAQKNRYRDRLPPLPQRGLPPVPALGIPLPPDRPGMAAMRPGSVLRFRLSSSSGALPATGTSSRGQGPWAFLPLSIPISIAISIPISTMPQPVALPPASAPAFLQRPTTSLNHR